MDEKRPNLYELLAGHEDETFYCTMCGDCKLKINKSARNGTPIGVSTDTFAVSLTKDGRLLNEGETLLFPSKDLRDWGKWEEEHKPKDPKTYSQLEELDKCKKYIIGCGYGDVRFTDEGDYPVEKSALALLKLYQIIEAGYGGIATADKEWEKTAYSAYAIMPDIENANRLNVFEFDIQANFIPPHITFKSRELATEFLSYPENVELLKKFYLFPNSNNE